MARSVLQRDDIIVPTPDGQAEFEFTLFAPGAVSTIAVVLTLLTIVFVGLRLYSRRLTNIGVKGDDWAILAATVLTTVLCALDVADTVIGSQPEHIHYIFSVVVPATSLGVGLQADFEAVLMKAKLALAISDTYASILGLIKISMLLLYKRIFTQKWLHVAATAMMLATFASWCFFIAATGMFSVKLYNAFHNGTSRASWSTTQAALILDVTLDGIILLLPTPIVWNLKMTLGKKLQVLTLFAIGSLWMIASAVRLIYLSQSVYTSHVDADNRFIAAVRTSFYFTITATCLGICHACLPTFRPLIERLLSKNPRMHSFLRRLFSSRIVSLGHGSGRGGIAGTVKIVPLPTAQKQTRRSAMVNNMQHSSDADLALVALPDEDTRENNENAPYRYQGTSYH